jgi:hypothetical protein
MPPPPPEREQRVLDVDPADLDAAAAECERLLEELRGMVDGLQATARDVWNVGCHPNLNDGWRAFNEVLTYLSAPYFFVMNGLYYQSQSLHWTAESYRDADRLSR